MSPYPRRSKSGGRKEGHNRDKQDQVIQTTNGRFVSCVSLCFPCYAQGAEIHEIFGKGKRFSERAHTSLILGLASVAIVLGMLVALPVILSILLAVGTGSIPFLVVAIKRHRRFLMFEEQSPEAIDFLARAVRAGFAFTAGLSLIATEMEEPVAGEFRKTYDQQNLGLPLREAFRNLTRRMPLSDVQIFVTALTIQGEAGGNLAEILDNLSNVVRERFKLVRQVKALTAQGRLTLYILIAVPPIAGVSMFLLNAEYVSVLFEDPIGRQALMVAAVLQVIGYFIIRKIVEPKV